MRGVLSFLAGAGAGEVMTLLLAPQSGKETQRIIAKRVRRSVDQVAATSRKVQAQTQAFLEKGQDLVDVSKDLVSTGKERMVEAIQAGKEAYLKQKAAFS